MPRVLKNGGLIGTPADYSKIYEPITHFSLVDSSHSLSNSVTVPTTASAGDFAVLVDNIASSTVISTPSTWTTVLAGSAGDTNISVTVAYKILTASDVGATVESTNTTTTNHAMQISVIRANNGDAAFSSASISGLVSTVTTGNPGSQTVTLSSTPTFGVAVYAQRVNDGQMSISTTPINDAVANTLSGSNIKIRTHFKFFGSGTTPSEAATAATMTIDLADNGQQGQAAFIVTPTSATGVKEYNSGIWALDDVFESTYKAL